MTILLGVKVSVKGEDVVCRARLLFVVADLPAKACLLNMIQFNGKFGCSTCYHEGKQVLYNMHVYVHVRNIMAIHI